MAKKAKEKKVRDIVVPEEELFGMPLEHSFVDEVNILRTSVASRLRALSTGYRNMEEEYKVQFLGKELLRIELYCLDAGDSWFVTIDGDGTVGFERKTDIGHVAERYSIPNDWTEEQILDYPMPEQVVKEYLKRQRWTPACFDSMLAKAERKLADALSAMVDSELKKVNSARKILNASLNDLSEERKNLQADGEKKNKELEEVEASRKSLQEKVEERKKVLAEKQRLLKKEDQTFRRLEEKINKQTQKLAVLRRNIGSLKKKLESN